MNEDEKHRCKTFRSQNDVVYHLNENNYNFFNLSQVYWTIFSMHC